MKLDHPLLRKTAEAVIDQVPKQLRRQLLNAVMAGETALSSKEFGPEIQRQMQREGDPADLIGEGVAKLIAMIWMDSQGKLPLRILIPAGQVLVCTSLEFMIDAGVFDDVNSEDIGMATESYVMALLEMLGATPDKIQEYLSQAGALPQEGMPQEAPPQEAAAPAGIINAQQGAPQ